MTLVHISCRKPQLGRHFGGPHCANLVWTDLAYPRASNSDSAKLQQQLIKMAYEAAPEEIINTLIVLIDKDNREYSHISVTSELEGCWDSRLAGALFTKVMDKTLKPECGGDLLAELLDHGVSEAKVFTESLFPCLLLPRVIDEPKQL
jgi:hypothetical protein